MSRFSLGHDGLELRQVAHGGFPPQQLLEEHQGERHVDDVVVVQRQAAQDAQQEVGLLLHFGLFGVDDGKTT